MSFLLLRWTETGKCQADMSQHVIGHAWILLTFMWTWWLKNDEEIITQVAHMENMTRLDINVALWIDLEGRY